MDGCRNLVPPSVGMRLSLLRKELGVAFGKATAKRLELRLGAGAITLQP
jgi:hypothetical protein